MSENQPEKALFQMIAEALTPEGTLPKDFSLPKEKVQNKLIFADGAMDGIKLYHTQPKTVDIEPVCQALLLISQGQEETGKAQLTAALEQHSVIEVIDALHKWIYENHDQLDPGKLSGFAIRSIMTSANPELIKLGLAIMELLNTDKQEALKKVIRALALCNEFTLYCLFIMRSWTRGNDEIFDLMQKVHGWGRIHCVNQIDPANRLIKKWLLDHGCENSVAPAYSALTVAKKCDLIEQIQREDLSAEDWSGITLMMDGLMAEGPVAGISEIEDRETLFAGYLAQTEHFPMTLATVQNLIAIAQYIDGEQVKMPEIKKQCLELLKSSACYVTVSAAMEQGKGFEEALKLSIPYEEKAMTWLKQNPVEHCMAARLLMASENACDEILALYADCLPLDTMASGPSDVLGLGKDYQDYHALAAVLQSLKLYPGKGVEFIRCALLCPVISCRTYALDTLESWVKLAQTSLKGIAPELLIVLEQASELEVKEELKTRILTLKQSA
mgnify:CR=1 FL=1